MHKLTEYKKIDQYDEVFYMLIICDFLLVSAFVHRCGRTARIGNEGQ
jgi:hypothetical protein